MDYKNNKILVAMSGGVDSAVAAALLKKAGFNVTGVFMINWREDDILNKECSWEKDYLDARRVAAKLGIKLFTWDFSKEYKRLVFDYFIKSYENGLTPNPDTLCNKMIKFGLFLKKAKSLGFDKIATGHYAIVTKTLKQKNTKTPFGRLRAGKNTKTQEYFNYKLVTAEDKTKDQSYFLYELGQKELERIVFPVGDLTKKQVRVLAKRFGLPVADKKDSYGICYIGEKNMKEFLPKFIKENKGEIIDKNGRLLGGHEGLHFYTIGQRKRIEIGGSGPYYVLKKNIEKNQLTVTKNQNDKDFFKKEICVKNINFISGLKPEFPFKCFVRFRHLQKLQKAVIYLKDDKVFVKFKKPQKPLAEGQAAVFYKRLNFLSRDFEVAGGGIIC